MKRRAGVVSVVAAVGLACGSIAAGIATAAGGDLDPSFGLGGVVRDDVDGGGASDVALTPSGRILAVGTANTQATDAEEGLLEQFSGSGDSDPTYGVIGTVRDQIVGDPTSLNAVAIRPTGQAVVAGFQKDDEAAGLPERFIVAQYTAAGVIDTGFSGDGVNSVSFAGGAEGRATDVALYANGAAMVVGHSTSVGDQDISVARFQTNGQIDGSFFPSGPGFRTIEGSTAGGGDDRATSVVIDPADGDFIVAGTADTETADSKVVVARFASPGVPDTGFGGGDGIVRFDVRATANDVAEDLVLAPDGRIIVTGSTIVGSDLDHFVARLETDGDLDPTFGDGADGIFNGNLGGPDRAFSLARLADGKVILGGSHSPNAFVARYTAAGLPDTGFVGDGVRDIDFNDGAATQAVLPLADGKLLAAGSVSNDLFVTRLLADDPPAVVTPVVTPPVATPPAQPTPKKCKKGQKLKKGKCVKKKKKKRAA